MVGQEEEEGKDGGVRLHRDRRHEGREEEALEEGVDTNRVVDDLQGEDPNLEVVEVDDYMAHASHQEGEGREEGIHRYGKVEDLGEEVDTNPAEEGPMVVVVDPILAAAQVDDCMAHREEEEEGRDERIHHPKAGKAEVREGEVGTDHVGEGLEGVVLHTREVEGPNQVVAGADDHEVQDAQEEEDHERKDHEGGTHRLGRLKVHEENANGVPDREGAEGTTVLLVGTTDGRVHHPYVQQSLRIPP